MSPKHSRLYVYAAPERSVQPTTYVYIELMCGMCDWVISIIVSFRYSFGRSIPKRGNPNRVYSGVTSASRSSWRAPEEVSIDMPPGLGRSSGGRAPSCNSLDHLINPAWWMHLQFGLFYVPTSGPRLVHQILCVVCV